MVITVQGEPTRVLIKNYFTSQSSTNSSVKKIKIGNNTYDIINDGLIRSGIESFSPDGKGVIKGTMFSDEIKGTDGNDKIYATSGNDTIIGTKGNDSIYGG